MAAEAVRRDDPITPAAATTRIREPEFAKRLNKALDDNPYAPEMNRGRLVWLRDRLSEKGLKARSGKPLASETVRRWIHGEVKPLDETLSLIAQILEVDEAWLSLGHAPELAPREQRLRNAEVDGAVNVVAGLIQMNGGHPAFPEAGDARAAKEHIDLYAIIKGAQYAFHVTLGWESDGGLRFAIPSEFHGAFQLGVVQSGDLEVELYELPVEAIEELGGRRGGHIDVTFDRAFLAKHRIRSFRNRL